MYGAPPPPYSSGHVEADVAGVEERLAPGAHLRPVEPRCAAAMALELARQVLVEPRAQLRPERGLLGRVAEIHRPIVVSLSIRDMTGV